MKKFLILCLVLAAWTARAVPGDQNSIQRAIDSASPGSTVTIDNGNWTWAGSQTITCEKAIKILGQSRSGCKITVNSGRVDNVLIIEPPSGVTEFGNCTVHWNKADNVWPYMFHIKPQNPRTKGRVLMHDMYFTSNYAYPVLWDTNGGVIYNCEVEGTGSGGLTGFSFVVSSLPSDWTRVSTVGTKDTDGLSNTYVEDCKFAHADQAINNCDDNSRVVFRHCIFDNLNVGSHGQETSPWGCRQWEFYDNEFLCDADNKYNVNCFLGMRGGTGIITNNHFDDIPWDRAEINLNVYSIRRKTSIPCQTQYPAARQVGQGWIGEGGYSYPSVPQDGTGYFTDPICIWNNTGTVRITAPDYYADECGNNQHSADYVKQGRDYLITAPPGGYTKYPYPHPLRSGGGPGPSPTPSATPSPSATPQPTVTPSPSATPNPTPPPQGETYRNWLDRLSNWIRQNPAQPD